VIDFLTFKSFISIKALIAFYYLGALAVPAGIWLLQCWVIRRYGWLKGLSAEVKGVVWRSLNLKQRIIFIALFSLSFLFAELFWRMLFEFLIAYMQMRDALLQGQL